METTQQSTVEGDTVEPCRVEHRRKVRLRFTTGTHVLKTTLNRVRGWRDKHHDPESEVDIPGKIEDAAKMRSQPKKYGVDREDARNSLTELVDSVLHADLDDLQRDDDWRHRDRGTD